MKNRFSARHIENVRHMTDKGPEDATHFLYSHKDKTLLIKIQKICKQFHDSNTATARDKFKTCQQVELANNVK